MDLTNGGLLDPSNTTRACADISPKHGVAVAGTDAQLAMARGLDPLIAEAVFQKGQQCLVKLIGGLTHNVLVAEVRIRGSSLLAKATVVRILKILQAHDRVAVCLVQWGRRKAVLKLATGHENQVDVAVRAYSKLQGVPGVVKLYRSGTVSVSKVKVSALLREYVAGPTLDEVRSSIDLQLLRSQLTRIVKDVHRRGVVVRDLKPDNVVLKARVPRIFDFGCAGSIGGRAGRGTKGFASPNAAQGLVAQTSDDWFSLDRTIAFVRRNTKPTIGS